MLMVNYAVNILTNVMQNLYLDRFIFLYYSLGFIGTSCFYIAHWLFTWQYWLVAQLMAQEVTYNLRSHNLVKYAMCALIVIIELVIAIGASLSDNTTQYLHWMEPIFMLIDAIVLVIALCKTN